MRKMFRGELFFLSNMYPHNMEYKGVVAPSAENVYQAMKFEGVDQDLFMSLLSCAPRYAKTMAAINKHKTRPDFDRHAAMFEVLTIKYQHDAMKQKLLDTGDDELVEWNTWGDKYWGKDINTGTGLNQLGEMHMMFRQSIRAEMTFFGG